MISLLIIRAMHSMPASVRPNNTRFNFVSFWSSSHLRLLVLSRFDLSFRAEIFSSFGQFIVALRSSIYLLLLFMMFVAVSLICLHFFVGFDRKNSHSLIFLWQLFDERFLFSLFCMKLLNWPWMKQWTAGNVSFDGWFSFDIIQSGRWEAVHRTWAKLWIRIYFRLWSLTKSMSCSLVVGLGFSWTIYFEQNHLEILKKFEFQ